jgi:hypothetical protein
MLTVIAVSLVYLCVAHILQPPTAQAAAQYSVPTIEQGSPDGPTAYVPVVVFEAKWNNGVWAVSQKP